MNKKIASLSIIGILSFLILTGCGNPKPEELTEKIFEGNNKSAEYNVAFDLNMTYKDTPVIVKANSDVYVENDTDEKKAYVSGNVLYNISDKDKEINLESYLLTNKDNIKLYVNKENVGWTYYEEDANKYELTIDDNVKDIFASSIKKILNTGEVMGKSSVVNGENCYLLTVKPTGQQLLDFIYEMSEAENKREDLEEFVSDLENNYNVNIIKILDNIGIKLNLFIAQTSGEIAKFSIDFSNINTDKIIEGLGDLKDIFEIDEESIEVKTLSFVFNCKNINNTTVDISDTILDNALLVSFEKKDVRNEVENEETDEFDTDYLPGGYLYFTTDEAMDRLIESFSFAGKVSLDMTIADIENLYGGYEQGSVWTFSEINSSKYYEYDLSDNQYFDSIINTKPIEKLPSEAAHWKVLDDEEKYVIALIADRYKLTDLFYDCGAGSEIYDYITIVIYGE